MVGKARTALSLGRPLTRAELAFAWSTLAILAILAFLPHVLHGGFYQDDWSNGAITLLTPGGAGNVLSHFAEVTISRPGLVVYLPLTFAVFGMNETLHLAWAATLALTVSALLYGVLRTLGVLWIHALIITALVLLYPWFDSIRFWAGASSISVSIALVLAGLWIALIGLSRRSWIWHLCAASLYLASILTYEVTLPVVASLGILYVWRSGWVLARGRWAVDIAIVLAGAIWVGSHTTKAVSSLSGDLSHLGEIFQGGAKIVGLTAIPVGTDRTALALTALGLIFALGLIALKLAPNRFSDSRGQGLSAWLALGGAGLVLTILGWVMFIPADPYYTPVIWGETNRVNGLAGIGAVITVYGALGVVGVLVGRAWRRVGTLPLAITLTLGLLLGAGYVTVIRRHTGIWNSAYVAEVAALEKINTRYPQLPTGTTLYASGYPANQTLGVPILSSTWDLAGMLKTHYGDSTIFAYPITSGSTLACRSHGVVFESNGAFIHASPYGTTRMIDLATGGNSLPRSQRDCRAVVGRYRPGPLYLSFDY